MEVGDRVVINTEGRFKWVDGKTGAVQAIGDYLEAENENQVLVRLDGMDPSKPPFGLASVLEHEVQSLENRGTDDPINHPAHYTDGQYECIDYIESKGYVQDGYLFNAVKYISRAGKKDPDKFEEDIQKAIWYLNRKNEGKRGDRRYQRRIDTNDYVRDKGLEGTLSGLALKLIENKSYELAAETLQMELDSHKEHSSK